MTKYFKNLKGEAYSREVTVITQAVFIEGEEFTLYKSEGDNKVQYYLDNENTKNIIFYDTIGEALFETEWGIKSKREQTTLNLLNLDNYTSEWGEWIEDFLTRKEEAKERLNNKAC